MNDTTLRHLIQQYTHGEITHQELWDQITIPPQQPDWNTWDLDHIEHTPTMHHTTDTPH